MLGPCTAVCVYVRFADGLIWGPADESTNSYLCHDRPPHVHCRICGSLTALIDLDALGVVGEPTPGHWAAIIRGTSLAPQPSCEHWVPITTRLTPKD